MSRILRPMPSGQMVAGYQLTEDEDGQVNGGRVILPEHVRKMKWKAKKRWMDERGLVPAVGGGAGYGSSFLQMLEPFQVADGATLSTSVTETVITSDTLMTLPPNFFAYPGKQAWFRVMGKMSNTAAAVTITFRLRYNAIGGTVLCTSGAITCNASVATDNMWYVEAWLEALATGPTTTSLTMLTYGECFVANTGAAAADIRNASMPPGLTALANVASLDGTVGKALSLTAQWGTSNAGNAITVRNCFIVALN